MTASQTGVRRWYWRPLLQEFQDSNGDECACEEIVSGYAYDSLLASHAALAKALTKLIAQIEDLGEDMPLVSSGCIECTAGTVPNHLNTGLCGYHAAKVALRSPSGEGK